MGNYKKTGDDILKEWLDFREDPGLAYITKNTIFNLMKLANAF